MRHAALAPILRYGTAVLTLAAACLTRWLADPALGDHAPYVLVLLAVILTAWHGGVGPSLLTLALGLFFCAHFFVPPRDQWAGIDLSHVLSLILHATLGLGVILLVRSLHAARERAERLAAEALERQRELERAAAQRQRDEEARFRLAAIVEGSQDAIVGLDADGIIISWNKGAERLYGYRAEEILGEPFSRLLPAGTSGVTSSIMSRLKRGEEMAPYETVRVGKGGRMVEVVVTVSPIKGTDGRLIGFSTIAREIGERKAAEKALRDSEARYRLAVRAANDGIWDWDVAAGRVRWNAAYERLFGRRPKGARSGDGSWAEDIHPEDRQRVLSSLKAALEGNGDHWEAEYRYRRADGGYAFVLDRACILRDSDGRPIRVTGAMHDQTERKLAAAELERLLAREREARAAAEAAERRARFLGEASTLLASTLDPERTLKSLADLTVPYLADWTIVEVIANTEGPHLVAAAHRDPTRAEEARGLARAYPPDSQAPRVVPRVLRSGRPELYPDVSEEMLRDLARDAGHLALLRGLGLRSAMVVPLLVRGRTIGAITFVAAESGRRYGPADLALAEDLAWRAALAIDNARLYRELCEAEQRRQAYVLSLAHELRNPLAPVLNGLQVLEMAGDDPTVQQKARTIIERQVRHMARLIDALLEVSRVTAGKVHLKRAWVDLVALVGAAAEDRRQAFEAAGLTLTVELPTTPVWLLGDATRLAQVMSNLLENSLKFTETGGVTVRVTTEPAEDEACVSIRDTGIGIDPAVLPRIFEVFAQGDRSLERSRGGLGLGLALVKGLTELHHGRVEARSDGPGHGTEVLVYLPYDPDHVETVGHPQVNGPISEVPAHLRVLVVEDHRDAAESLRTLLQMSGHEVALAYTGPDGLERARTWRPDVVLTDIGLPGMSGLEVARALRADPDSGALLIAVSGYAQSEDHLGSPDWPFDASLTKPVDFEELQSLMTRLIRHGTTSVN